MNRSVLFALLFAFGCDLLKEPPPPATASAEPAKTSGDATKQWDPSSGTKPPPAMPPADSWIAFESAEGKFKAEFPVAPSTETSTVPIGTISLQMVTYSAEIDDTYYAVATSDYPPELVDGKAAALLLDGARDGAVANIAGKLKEEKQLELDGHPARRFVITGTTEGVDLLVDGMLVLVNRRLYQGIVVREAKRDDAGKVARFLESIHPI